MLSFLNIFDSPHADRPKVEQTLLGEWVYEGRGISAVGARAMTLGEKVDPLMVARPGQEPVAVLLPVSEVAIEKKLHWAFQAGTEIDGEDGPLLQVPYSVWQEHAGEVVGPWLPEREGEGIDRSLAVYEREFRFAQEALETTRLARNCLVILATRLGRSRREVGEILGLSLGRVQQLNENPPAEVVKAVDELVEAAGLVAKNIGNGCCPRGEVPKPRPLTHEELARVIDSMLMLGLLEEESNGLRLTADGAALSSGSRPVAQRRRKGAGDRERAGDATG